VPHMYRERETHESFPPVSMCHSFPFQSLQELLDRYPIRVCDLNSTQQLNVGQQIALLVFTTQFWSEHGDLAYLRAGLTPVTEKEKQRNILAYYAVPPKNYNESMMVLHGHCTVAARSPPAAPCMTG
jgi:hypothetical protein